MYSLFNSPAWGNDGASISFPNYEYALKGLRKDLERVVQYNRVYPRAVKSNHFLVKLIQNLNLNFTLEPMVLRDRAEETAETVSMVMNMTSSLSKGKIFSPGVFYGEGSSEILVAHSEDFDLTNLETEWEDYRPIQFLCHPKSDLNMDTPYGFQNNAEEGLSVILVNIPMLACQYMMWRRREWQFNSEAQRTTSQFVSSYPLNNALYSQLDVALFNRFRKTYAYEDLGTSLVRRSFALTDWSPRVDRAHQALADEFDKRKLSFDQALRFVKLVSVETAREVVRIPPMPPTRQVVWAMLLARVAVVKFLLQWNKETKSSKNKAYLNTIRLETQRILNDSALKSNLSGDRLRFWEGELKSVLELV